MMNSQLTMYRNGQSDNINNTHLNELAKWKSESNEQKYRFKLSKNAKISIKKRQQSYAALEEKDDNEIKAYITAQCSQPNMRLENNVELYQYANNLTYKNMDFKKI